MQNRFRRGGRRSGRGGAPGIGPAGLGVIGGLAALAWVLSGVVIVDEKDRATVFRLGKWDRNFGPGLHLHLPWPFEHHEVVRVTQQQTTIGSEEADRQMLTRDENIVEVRFKVFWKYDATHPERSRLNINDSENLLRTAAESVMREAVGKSNLNGVITSERAKLQLDVQKQLTALLNDYQSGILVENIVIEQVEAPAPVRQAFLDVINADQDAEKSRQEAARYANTKIPQARGEAAKIVAAAEGYRQEVVAVATGEAARFDAIYAEYRKAPQVTRERLYLKTMERVLQKSDKLVLDSDSGAVPYLPIDRAGKTGKEQ
jgi:membrane protease subunit HflK